MIGGGGGGGGAVDGKGVSEFCLSEMNTVCVCVCVGGGRFVSEEGRGLIL